MAGIVGGPFCPYYLNAVCRNAMNPTNIVCFGELLAVFKHSQQ
jgi:hypothetical protein